MYYLGPAFRKIRHAKNLTLKEATEGVVSANFASRWERGLSKITTANLTGLLEKTATTYEELMLIHHHHDISLLNQHFFEKVDEYVNVKNLDGLYSLMEQEEQRTNTISTLLKKHRLIILKQRINQMNKLPFENNKIKIIIDYLQKIDLWGIYELSLYANSIFMLSASSVTKLSTLAQQKGTHYQELSNVTEEICNASANTAIYFLDNNMPNNAISTIHIAQEFLEKKNLFYEKNRFSFLEGIYLLEINKYEYGLKKIANAIHRLNEMATPETISLYHAYLEKALIKNFPKR
ncbi:MAG: hypothetical protein LBS33_08075, partial [Streptococcaceae bacterium]|nr:hypothetical protein [Streptococcaceae bacterium]